MLRSISFTDNVSLPTSGNENQPKMILNLELARNAPLLHVLRVKRQVIVKINTEIVEKRAAEGEFQKGCTSRSRTLK